MAIEITTGGITKSFKYFPSDAIYVDANGSVNTNGNGRQVKEAYFDGTRYYPENTVPSDIIRPNGTTKKAIATGGISGVLMVDYPAGGLDQSGLYHLTKYVPISEVPTPNWRTDPIARLEKLPQVTIPFSIQCAALISGRVNISHEEAESSGGGYLCRYTATLKNNPSSFSRENCINDAQCRPIGVPRTARVTNSSDYWGASGVVKLSVGEVTFIDVFYGVVLYEYSETRNDDGWRHHKLRYPAMECVIDDSQSFTDENIRVNSKRFYDGSLSLTVKGIKGIDQTSNNHPSCKLYTDATGEVFASRPSPLPTEENNVEYTVQFSVPYSDIQNIDNDSDYWPSLS